MSDVEYEYASDQEGGGDVYKKGHIQAARSEDNEDAELTPFVNAIYAFKLAASAAFREHFIKSHPQNTDGVGEYQAYLAAIESLWNTKSHTLHKTLTPSYNILTAEIRRVLQTMLNKIHQTNNPQHSFAANSWIRRLFVECAGSTNKRSFDACKEAEQPK
jgi:hypothetical protein